MIYIKSIKIESNLEGIPGADVLKSTVIECRKINIIVGNQGAGKSTLLKLLQRNDPMLTLELGYPEENIESFYFNAELDNPRIKNPDLYTDINGCSTGYGPTAAVAARFRSHGEILKELTLDLIPENSRSVVIIDEPESGLSIQNQWKLFRKIVHNADTQFFIATHCQPLIASTDVYSLDHWEWMPGQEYLDYAFQQSFWR